ncbi:LacI family DNA-binding transcriptional regulator [Sphingomonas sp. AP4-R1]|uniref:LacI family DNA-binding transcriptional regulator n=1 Tax=Sphingomonas sp. AP4-R1 TaxID=2735134 RepID=UPI001493A293|nr:LacI family DNA-binding transcriptional regulator [Sphingomonas sp. AP4-R1]QJU57909.1 LacI family DNA-binding transcriptional regulator [Sphingomonas sp. AP4-R1]
METAERRTIVDLASAAGVSVSTVDRVLNGRHPVRQVTADRVLEAAERIGFRGLTAIRHRVANSRPVGRLGFLLQRPGQKEYRLWGEHLAEATRASTIIHGRPVVRFVEDLTPDNVVDHLMALSREVDAVALVAADHPRINHAVDMLAADGVQVFTLVTDLSAAGVVGHIGIDDLKKGRTAGWFVKGLARRAGPVAVIVGNARYMSQDLAETGFRGYLREHAPDVRLLQTAPTLEDDAQAFSITEALLRDEPDLAGIYVAGGGIGGVIAALRARGGAEEGPVVVVNELTEETREALTDGVIRVVLSHPAGQMAKTAVEMMALALVGQNQSGRRSGILPFETFTSENV